MLAFGIGWLACKTPAPTPQTSAVAPPPASSVTAAPLKQAVDAEPPRSATIGDDTASAPRRRVPTAVVLLGNADLAPRKGMRFQPIACAINGVLTGGIACSTAMPALGTARLTHASAAMPRTVTLRRAQRGFVDEAGGQTLRAPLEPSCCMYNACIGETHAFLPGETVPVVALVLAVWPADADVDLVPHDGTVDEAIASAAIATPNTRPKLKISQAFRAGSRTIVVGSFRPGAVLSIDDGAGPEWVEGSSGRARTLDVLATTDLDHDGRTEAIVFEAWQNDYGLSVLGNDPKAPLYGFSCGNM